MSEFRWQLNLINRLKKGNKCDTIMDHYLQISVELRIIPPIFFARQRDYCWNPGTWVSQIEPITQGLFIGPEHIGTLFGNLILIYGR